MVYGMLILACCVVCLLMRMPKLQQIRCLGLIVMMTMTAIVSGLRSSDVGTDGPMYARLIGHSDRCLEYGFEAGYCLLNSAVHWSGVTYTVLFVLESLLLYGAIGLFIYRYVEKRWWGFSCLMIFGTRMFFMAMNISRQYIAAALCLLAFMLYERRRRKSALGLVLLAMTFHITAIVVLLVPLIGRWARSERFEFQSAAAVVVAFLMQFLDYGGIISWIAGFIPKYRHYQHDSLMDNTGTSASLMAYTLALSVVYIVYMWRRKRNERAGGADDSCGIARCERDDLLLAGALVYVVVSDAFAGVGTLSRVSVFFTMFFIWLLTALLATLGKRMQIAVELLVLIVSFLVCYRQVYIRGNFGVLPYRTFF